MKRIILILTITLFTPFVLLSQWESSVDYLKSVDGAFSFVIDSKAYVGGGIGPEGVSSTFAVFDPNNDKWSELAELPNGGRAWAFGFAANGKGYFGGGDEKGDLSGVTKDFWEYDPVTNEWTKLQDFPGGIRDGCYSFAVGDNGYVGAGFDGQFVKTDGYKYNTSTDSWSPIADLPEPMLFPASFVIDNEGYVGLGGQGFDNQLKTLYRYNATNNSWEMMASLPDDARQAMATFVYKGIAYVGGGQSDYSTNYTDVFKYDSKTDKWSKDSEFELPYSSTAWPIAFAIGDVGYFGTGVELASFNYTNKMYKYEFVKSKKPILSLETQVMDFGDVKVSTSEIEKVAITNIGDTLLLINDISFESQSEVFTLPSNIVDLLPIQIEPKAFIELEIIFTPEEEKDYNNTLYLQSNSFAKDTSKIFLSGSGLGLKPNMLLEVTELDFGTLKERESSTKCFTIKNDGEGVLTINEITLSNNDSDFKLDQNVSFPWNISSKSVESYCVSFESENPIVHTNSLFISSNDELSTAKIDLVADVEASISSVSDFPKTDELRLTTLNSGDNIEFSIHSNVSIETGRLEIYSTDGRVISRIDISGNSNNIHLNINKNELPPLSIIRLTQGERVYTYKYMRE